MINVVVDLPVRIGEYLGYIDIEADYEVIQGYPATETTPAEQSGITVHSARVIYQNTEIGLGGFIEALGLDKDKIFIELEKRIGELNE